MSIEKMQGSWIVRQSVGSTPCLLGKAVDCNYIRGLKYLEVKFHSNLSPDLLFSLVTSRKFPSKVEQCLYCLILLFN